MQIESMQVDNMQAESVPIPGEALHPSYKAASIKELDTQIAALASTLSSLQSTALQLKGAFFWRSVTPQAVPLLSERAQDFCKRVSDVQNQLYNKGGIKSSLAFFGEKQSVFTKLDKVHELERTILLLQITASLFAKMQEHTFLDTYTSIKAEFEALASKGSNPNLQELEERFVNIIENHFAAISFDSVTDELADQSKALLKTFLTADSEFLFWKNTDMSTWAKSWFPGAYEQTSPLARKIEEKVGLRISGLRNALRHMFERIYQGDDTGLAEMLAVYRASIAKLQHKSSTLRKAIYDTRFDGLTEPLLNYVNGLDMSLVELGYLHELCLRMSKSIGVFKAQSCLRTFLLLPAQSPIGALDTGETIRALSSMSIDPLQHNEVSEILSSAIKTTQLIYQKYLDATLLVTDDEMAVWEHVIRLQPYQELYKEAEQQVEEGPVAKPLVPQRLQSFFIKRTCRALYYPSKDGIDSELELFLHVIKTHGSYHDMFDHSVNSLLRTKSVQDVAQYDQWRQTVTNGDFHHAVVTYNGIYKKGRNENLLTRAVHTMALIFELAKHPRDIFSYAQVYQKCIEFSGLEVAGNLKPQLKIYSELLFLKLRIAAADANYIPMQEEPSIRPLHDWEEVIVSLASDEQPPPLKLLLEGFILRILACSLYAERAKERAEAASYVERLLKNDYYIPHLGSLCEEAKDLLCEYIFNKIIDSSDTLTDFERNLILNGPIQHFINARQESFSLSKAQQAIYILCLQEQTQIPEMRYVTNLFIESKGQTVFDRWQKKFRAFVTSSTCHHTFWEALMTAKDIDAATILAPYVGEAEAHAWTQSMQRSVAFTAAFVKK